MAPVDAMASTDASDGARAGDCAPGQVRCRPTGARQRCSREGTWSDEDFICTTRLAGSEDYDTFCGIKGDGRLSCWDRDGWSNDQARMLAAQFQGGASTAWREVAVWDGFFGACAIDEGGQVTCHAGLNGTISPPLSNLTFSAFIPTIYGNYGLLRDQHVICMNCTLPDDFRGPFQQIRASSGTLYGIDTDGRLHLPSYEVDALPPGRYTYLALNNYSVCAVREDARIFCDPNQLPPPTDAGYAQVAMSHPPGNACAVRTDGTLACWPTSSIFAAVSPPAGTFTTIAASDSAFCAIRTDGTTTCWNGGTGGGTVTPPPDW